jgi:high-affinity nickel-transport protein
VTSKKNHIGLVLSISALVVGAWAGFVLLVLPRNYVAGASGFGIGLAVTVFLLGMRHAFDADHIAAIDNTTRKLVGENRDASTVGLWFALGHSAVVLAAVGLITTGVTVFTSRARGDASPLIVIAGMWGPTVSSVFLVAIGSFNLVALVNALRRRSAAGTAPNRLFGGPVTSALRRAGSALDRPWKMFVVGLLFGLGFDTASTVGLLVVAAGAGILMPWYVAMVLPLLFTAGMVSCDGINSLVMSRAYSWSLTARNRRVGYNLALMGISVLVAFVIGGVGLWDIVAKYLRINPMPAHGLGDLPMDSFGFVVAGGLVLLWAVCFATYRVGTWRRARG